MKQSVLILGLLLFCAVAQAQTFSEWFKQKKTQKKYLIEQIAALGAYAKIARKGYDVARDGLSVIGSLKNGEFGLHMLYFNSLKAVNPTIAKHPKIAEVILMQMEIIQIKKNTVKRINAPKVMIAGEANYISEVFERLLDDCAGTMNDLTDVITAGQLEMKDDERIQRIDLIYKDMQDKYTFARNFSGEALMYAAERSAVQAEVKTGRALYGLNQQP